MAATLDFRGTFAVHNVHHLFVALGSGTRTKCAFDQSHCTSLLAGLHKAHRGLDTRLGAAGFAFAVRRGFAFLLAASTGLFHVTSAAGLDAAVFTATAVVFARFSLFGLFAPTAGAGLFLASRASIIALASITTTAAPAATSLADFACLAGFAAFGSLLFLAASTTRTNVDIGSRSGRGSR